MKTINDHMKAVLTAICNGTTSAEVVRLYNKNPKRNDASIYKHEFSNLVILDDGVCVFSAREKRYYRFDDVSSIDILD